MGPENSEKYTAVMMVDGKPVKIKPGIFHEIRYTSNEPCSDLLLPENEITIRMKMPKNYRCKSKKRFVKLLMSRGIQRNDAKKIAQTIVWVNSQKPSWMFPIKSYSEHWHLVWSGRYAKRDSADET